MWFEEINSVPFTMTGHRKGSRWERKTMDLILDMLSLQEEVVKQAAGFDKIQRASPVVTDTLSTNCLVLYILHTPDH